MELEATWRRLRALHPRQEALSAAPAPSDIVAVTVGLGILKLQCKVNGVGRGLGHAMRATTLPMVALLGNFKLGALSGSLGALQRQGRGPGAQPTDHGLPGKQQEQNLAPKVRKSSVMQISDDSRSWWQTDGARNVRAPPTTGAKLGH